MSPLLTGFAFGGASGSGIVASGGTKTTDGNYSVHTFTSSGTFTVTANPNTESFDILCIGGGQGGAGGYDFDSNVGFARPGDGGAGGGVIFDVRKLTATSYTVTIGAAGTGGTTANPSGRTAGGNTSFGTLEAIGGSGNGGQFSWRNANGTNGGTGQDSSGSQNGEAGQQGYTGNISGSEVIYIGGGGAGATGGAGVGGSGGGRGGNGGNGNDQSGTNATGNGGGGGGGGVTYQARSAWISNGGNGTAGIVVVRYRS